MAPEAWLSTQRFAMGLVVVTFVLLVFGATVRVHGAGLACPDWPLCFGQVVPPLGTGWSSAWRPVDLQVGLEFGHRVLAGAVSLGFLGLAGLVAWNHRTWGRGALALIGLAAAALAVQIVLGGLTVLQLLAEWTVTSHLLAGNAFCLLLLLVALRLREVAAEPVREPVAPVRRAVAVALALVVPVQLALGGLVSSSNAGLVCGTWPTCDGHSWFPSWAWPMGLQLGHRVVAYTLVALALTALAVGRARGRLGRAEVLVAVAVLGQATIGVANVLLHLKVEITLLHTAGAASVVLATTWLCWEAWRAPLAIGATAAMAEPRPALELR